MTNHNHFDLGSLSRFITELMSRGFVPVPGSNQTRWSGKTHPAFKELTDATTMEICIAAGWPFQPPAVFVQGLNSNHATPNGFVCMWRDGEYSEEWTTVDGLFCRIEEWCERARAGWGDDGLDQDAYLNYSNKQGLVATFNLPHLRVVAGSWGDCQGTINRSPERLDIAPGRKSKAHHLRGLWFHVGQLDTPPPRRFSEVSPLLSRSQRRGLGKALDERGKQDRTSSGGVDFILFCWERYGRTDLLVLACEGKGDSMDATALLAGPADEENLILRAGPDAPMLRTRKVVLFGAGALGSHTGTLLAESGVGCLDIVDPDFLLPGNVVRHVAGHSFVGARKVDAVCAVIAEHAPWTKISGFHEYATTPSQILERTADADIVVDTTGSEALVFSLSQALENSGKPLVSGALYRGGYIGRVQRQALSSDTPIYGRVDQTRYPLIPEGDAQEDFATSQLGCSAPVNNAPPTAVLACASLIAQSAIDVLTGRDELPDEVVDVYRAIPTAPFNRPGRLFSPAT